MGRTTNEKPGFMMYHKQFRALTGLDDHSFKRMLCAMCDYSEHGILPEGFDAAMQVIFDVFRDKLDDDASKYNSRSRSGQKGGIRSGQARSKEKNEADSSETKQTEATGSNAKQTEATGSNAKQTEATGSNAKQNNAEFAKQTEANGSETKQTEANSDVFCEAKRSNGKQNEANEPYTNPYPYTNPNTYPYIGNSSNSYARAREEGPEEEFPPTLEMVAEYIREKDLRVDAGEFLGRCEAAGWRDGKGEPVTNWRLWLKGYAIRNARPVDGGALRLGPDPRLAALEAMKGGSGI